jgi:dimeric dUTPase (all-alpha-NTP-PPase superfamily)
MTYLGEPDGTTADLRAYIPVGKKINFDFGNLATKVIVGRKGSGKSLCMRKFQENAERNPKLFVIGFRTQNPDLAGLIKFSTSIPHHLRTNTWQKIWKYSIILSAATIISHHSDEQRRYFQGVKKTDIDDILEEYHNCFLDLAEVTHPYDIVEVMMGRFDGYNDFLEFQRSPIVKNFENRITGLLRNSSTICFFLDALDEELRRSPSLLVDVTRALFYTTIQIARDAKLSGKLHVTIAVRDIIFSSIMTSEHADRYEDTSYIKSLPWDAALVEQFTQRKISIATKEMQESKSSWAGVRAESLQELLGFSTVANGPKGCDEDAVKYFIRHTNYVPRNVIRMGNRVFAHIDENGSIDVESYKKIVNDISRSIAEQLLKVSSAYLVAFSYDNEIKYLVELQEDFADYVLSKSIFKDEKMLSVMRSAAISLTDGFVEPIKEFVRAIGKDVFTRSELNEALSDFVKENYDYNQSSQNYSMNRLENILWTQGLLGVREEKGSEVVDLFYYFAGIGSLSTLPDNANQLVFFPGLADVCGLAIVPGRPVGT